MRTEDDLRRAMADAGARVPGAGPDARQSVAHRVRRQRAARLAPIGGVVVAAALAVGVLQLIGPNDSHKSVLVTNPGPPSEQTTTPAPPPTSAPAPSTSARAASTADLCTTRQFVTTADGPQGAAGHGFLLILFHNTGPSCRMAGYPGVAALGADGSQQAQARRTPTGFSGALATGAITPPTFQLATGETASAILEGLNAAPPAGTPCPSYAGLLITPPAQTESTRVSVAFSMCDLQIHPVVPGSDGGTGTSCGDYGFRPQSSDVATNIVASATTCTVARSVVAAGPDTNSPQFGKAYAARGFTCTPTPLAQPAGGGMSAWSYNCTDTHGAGVTFDRHG